MRLLTLLSLSSFLTHAVAAPLDANDLHEALAIGAVEILRIDGLKNRCSTAMPESKSLIHAYTLLWQDKNRIERWAIHGYTKTAPERWKVTRDTAAQVALTTFDALPKNSKAAHCSSLYREIQNGSQNISTRTPKASRHLTQYLESNPLSSTDVEKLNYVSGCAKQTYNKSSNAQSNFDLDRVTLTCECLWDTTEKNTTPEERKLEDETARQGKSLSNLPHMHRIAPLLSKCFSNDLQQRR